MIKVLVVDDSALVRKLFGRVLADAGDFEIAFARDGVDALQLIDAFKPDVVTLDVNMPQMDGLECLDRIMIQHPCPVVMVSTVTAEGADATLDALRLGAIDFVRKPTGAVSLRMEEFTPTFLATIRAAAAAKVSKTKRLRERVQLKVQGRPARVRDAASERATAAIEPASGDGLVLVGSSTGGPAALEALITALPATFPWPILVAQHMPASFTASLAKRLDGISELNVVEAASALTLQPGCVYIGRGDADIVVSKRGAGLVVMAAPARASYPWHPSTDRLVRSAMEHVPASQLIGILMTGMGDDGAAAMTELRAQGGKTIAESEETAIVWGMPGELVAAGGADWVVPLPNIAEQLQKLVPDAAHS